MNFQMILGNLSFAVLTWLVLIISQLCDVWPLYVSSQRPAVIIEFLYLYPGCAFYSAIRFSIPVKSRGAMSAAANVFALGTSFLSGVFVPQELLGSNVLTIASFTPTYGMSQG